jgi:hypothetical protein
MFKIFCDETWTVPSEYSKVKTPYIVFYGILLDGVIEESLLQKIESFKKQRGLFLPSKNLPVEVKW